MFQIFIGILLLKLKLWAFISLQKIKLFEQFLITKLTYFKALYNIFK
jgi:hypothetical protein